MSHPLLLPSSFIFEDPNLIDCIRQTSIDLTIDDDEGEIQDFLRESIQYLGKELQDDVIIELFVAIRTCFSYHPNQSLQMLTDFVNNVKKNANFIVITASIISILNQSKDKSCIQNCQSFVNEALDEVLNQIKKTENIKIFDLEISPQFKDDLIFDLLLSSNLTEKLEFDFIPYLFSKFLFSENKKFDFIIQILSNSNSIKILPQTETSNNEIIEFISCQNFDLIKKMSIESFSLIKSAVLYEKNEEKEEIEGLSKETILQFVSILEIYRKKLNKTDFSLNIKLLSDLFDEGIKFFGNNNARFLNECVDFILKNYNDFYHFNILSSDILLYKLVFFCELLQNGKFTASKKYLLLAFFSFSSDDKTKPSFFLRFPDKLNELFQIFYQNMSELNNCKNLIFNKVIKYDFIEKLIESNETPQNLIQIIDFIGKFKYREQITPNSKILYIIQNAINIEKEKNFDNVLKILKFMKENEFTLEFERMKEDEKELVSTKEIKEIIYDYVPSEEVSIDEIITRILADPNLEKDYKKFQFLFNKMIENDELFLIHYGYMFKKYGDYPFKIDVFMRLYKIEFEKYPEKFIDIINKLYYFNKTDNVLLRNFNFTYKSYPNSELGTSIIAKLFKVAEESNGKNYQAILCLHSIASSFPLLFKDFDQQLFKLASDQFKNISLLFNDNIVKENSVALIKSALSSIALLLSSFQFTILQDKFFTWYFTNFLTLNNYQNYIFICIISHILEDHKVFLMLTIYIMKFNFFGLLDELLEKTKEEKNELLKEVLRESIFKVISYIYTYTSKITDYEAIQIDEISKLEYPINYIFDNLFGTFSWIYLKNDIKIKGIQDKYMEFLNYSMKTREFWLYYDVDRNRNEHASTNQITNFTSKLNRLNQEKFYLDIANIPNSFTVKMVRYLVTKPNWLYGWFLFSKEYPLIQVLYEQLLETIKNLNILLNEAYDDPDGEDNCNSKSFTCFDYFLTFYCQQSLFKNLIRQVKYIKSSEDSNFKTLCTTFKDIASEGGISLLSILDLISQYITESGNDFSSKEMNMILDILNTVSVLNCFSINFADLCGKKLLDFVLSPNYRYNKEIITKTANLFVDLETEMPNRIIHFVAFILISNEVDKKAAIKICSKFNTYQLSCINEIILDLFDKESEKSGVSSIVLYLLENIPSILQERRQKFITILSNSLESYYSDNSNSRNEDTFNLIIKLLNILAPKRGNSPSLSIVIEKSAIPNNIKETSPIFWDLFEKYSEKIFESIENNPCLLNQLKFLLEYPELLNFKIRSSYFRRKMKDRIIGDYRVDLNVDRKNLLLTSFRSFRNKSTNDLLHKFRVNFRDEREVDIGGPTREWFNELSKEIFNQNYGLFDCSMSKKSYKPSSLSSINPNHLEYFKFAGQFIARVLIEGQCVDAHLTTSFCKQILHREPDLIDVEDADEELYRNLNWMLQNDVDPLDMYFEITVKELGVVKTIPLKENGEEIQVTNENKKEYVNLRTNYLLKKIIEEQINSFCSGFDSLISHDDIKIFTPNELDLLICGIPQIDVNDFIENITFEHPYNKDTPVVKMFFNVISKWDNEKLAKLLLFMTGSSRVPTNGFKEFCEMCNRPLTIASGGKSSNLPQSHTCFNMLCLPNYESEEELNQKIQLALQECNTFEMA